MRKEPFGNFRQGIQTFCALVLLVSTCFYSIGGLAQASERDSCIRQRDTLRARAAEFYQDVLMKTVAPSVSEGAQKAAHQALATCTEMLFDAERAYIASLKLNSCELTRYDVAVDTCRMSRDRIVSKIRPTH